MGDMPSAFTLKDDNAFKTAADEDVHVYGNKIVCATDRRGHELNQLEIVLDSSEGFVPLWGRGFNLRWRFNEASMQAFANPEAAKSAIREYFGLGLRLWEDAAPVRFSERDDAWDFELKMIGRDRCNIFGCTLARAFFPDNGRHDLLVYPELFKLDETEIAETFAHELGHVFGLRHFFAQVKEKQWPSEVFGEHAEFSIMNYGAKSTLTAADKRDLACLYDAFWSGKLKHINGTPTREFRPYHYG